MDYIGLGKRIKSSRSQHHYTQRQVAEQLHFSQKHFGNIERGDAHPSLECLVCIANVLEVSIDYLLQDSLILQPENIPYQYAVAVEQYLEQQQQSISNFLRKLKFTESFSSFENNRIT